MTGSRRGHGGRSRGGYPSNRGGDYGGIRKNIDNRRGPGAPNPAARSFFSQQFNVLQARSRSQLPRQERPDASSKGKGKEKAETEEEQPLVYWGNFVKDFLASRAPAVPRVEIMTPALAQHDREMTAMWVALIEEAKNLPHEVEQREWDAETARREAAQQAIANETVMKDADDTQGEVQPPQPDLTEGGVPTAPVVDDAQVDNADDTQDVPDQPQQSDAPQPEFNMGGRTTATEVSPFRYIFDPVWRQVTGPYRWLRRPGGE